MNALVTELTESYLCDELKSNTIHEKCDQYREKKLRQ